MRADLELGFDGDVHPMVRGDALLLDELINNLLDNAMRYAGTGAHVAIQVAIDGSQAVLTVEDDGPGVSEQELSRLTERFHRPQGSAPGGSGLGLAIVDEITQLHLGQLGFSLVQPHGLRIEVRLPCFQGEAISPPKDSP